MTEQDDLRESIEKLNQTEIKNASLRWGFLRGIFYGFGFFIGGTVIVSLLLYFASYLTARF